jgi:hypothetical protein
MMHIPEDLIDEDKHEDLEKTVREDTNLYKKTYFSHLTLDDGRPCPETNPVLWALFCASGDNRNPTDPVLAGWTEADVVNKILRDFAEGDVVDTLVRFISAMVMKGDGSVH